MQSDLFLLNKVTNISLLCIFTWILSSNKFNLYASTYGIENHGCVLYWPDAFEFASVDHDIRVTRDVQ